MPKRQEMRPCPVCGKKRVRFKNQFYHEPAKCDRCKMLWHSRHAYHEALEKAGIDPRSLYREEV